MAQLAAGESLALPPEAVAYLQRLRSLGIPEVMIGGERDAWILVAAQLPEQMAFSMQMKEQQLDDPETVAFYRDIAEAIGWGADDRRLVAVADRLVGLIESADEVEPADGYAGISDALVDLLDSVFVESLPAARRLLELMEERGWRGWTRLERIPATVPAS